MAITRPLFAHEDLKVPLLFKIHKGGTLPCKAYEGDAGYDLTISRDAIVGPGEIRGLDTGLAVELPPGYWGLIHSRSSTLLKYRLFVNPGIIDNGYRGLLYVNVWNPTTRSVVVEKGVRLAQLIPFRNVAEWLSPRESPELSVSERGDKGFGSSGA